MDYKKYIAEKLHVDGVSADELYEMIALPPNTEMGDYALPCFKLAKVMRKELKARGINSLTVVYSKETPVSPKYQVEEKGRHIPASISYPPAIAGLKLAGYVIRVLID